MPVERVCKSCGKSFTTYPSRPGTACSRKCSFQIALAVRAARMKAEALARVTDPFESEGGMVAHVHLTCSVEVAVIDAEDRDIVASRNWTISPNGYVCAGARVNGKSGTTLLHRFLLCPDASMCVDHINGNRLDNRRANLRVANKSQNRQNYHSLAPSRTGFRNVYFHSRGAAKPYYARITVKGKTISLGYFETAEAANLAACAGRKRLCSHSPENRPS